MPALDITGKLPVSSVYNLLWWITFTIKLLPGSLLGSSVPSGFDSSSFGCCLITVLFGFVNLTPCLTLIIHMSFGCWHCSRTVLPCIAVRGQAKYHKTLPWLFSAKWPSLDIQQLHEKTDQCFHWRKIICTTWLQRDHISSMVVVWALLFLIWNNSRAVLICPKANLPSVYFTSSWNSVVFERARGQTQGFPCPLLWSLDSHYVVPPCAQLSLHSKYIRSTIVQ